MADAGRPPSIDDGREDIVLPRGASTRRRGRSIAGRFAIATGSAFLMAGLALLTLFVALSRGPVSAPFIKDRVAEALEARLGRGIDVEVGDAKLEKTAHGLEVHVYDVVFKDIRGKEIVRSPEALIALDPLRLAAFQIAPRRLSLQGMTVRAQIAAEGSVRLTTEDRAGAQAQSVQIENVLAFLVEVARTGTFSGLNAISIENARLLVDDRRVGREIAFEDMRANFENAAPGRSAVEGSLRRGRFTVPYRLEAQQRDDGASLRFSVSSVPLTFAGTLGGSDALRASGDSKAALTATLEVNAEGKAISGVAEARLTPGRIALPALHDEGLTFQEASVRAEWSGAPDRIEQVVFRFLGEDGRGVVAGPLLMPTADRRDYLYEAAAKELVLAPLSPRDGPLIVSDGRLKARIGGAFDSLVVDELSLTGAETALRLSGEIRKADGGAAARLSLEAGRMPLRAALRWWPSIFARGGRTYLADAVQSGTLTSLRIGIDLDAAGLKAALRDEPLPQHSIKLDVAAENATIQPVEGLPPIAGISGRGWLDALRAQFSANQGIVALKGTGQRIQLSEGLVDINRLDLWTPDLAVQFRAQSQAEAAAEFLSLPALKDVFPARVPPKDIRGQFDGRARISMTLGKEIKPGDITTEANATLRNITLDNAIGKDRLENANLTISADRTGTEVKGEGRWQGMPVNVSLETDAKDRSSATVLSFTLDEAAQRKYGLQGQVIGPLPVRIRGERAEGETLRAQVEVDLARAAIDGLVPGFQKAAGRPGRLTFEAQERRGGGYGLQNIALDSGPVSIRGQAETAQDGAVTQARFSLFRLSPGDNVRLDFDRTPTGGRVSIRGNNFDARPFLRQAMQDGPAPPRNERDIDLDVRSTLLSGFNGEVLTNAEVKAQRRSGQLRQLAVTGRLNGKAVSISGQAADRPAPVSIESDDAGALLRFLDVYTRMIGGDLQGQIRTTPREATGFLISRNFNLRNEPALRRLLSEGAEDGAPRADNAAFQKMRIDFSRTGTVTTIRDAVIFGPQLGVTFNGTVDFPRDRISLSGTYVPAYGLNNAFAQIPVLGNILGGGRNEGLLAVTFGVSGRVSQPQVTVNPLSAVAPGIFRKIFEFRNDRTGASVAPVQPPTAN